MMLRIFNILFLFILISTPVGAVTRSSNILKEISTQEPSFSEIVEVAFKREDLHWDQSQEWKKKMKLAPWFPKLYVGFDRALKETNSISITDNISVTSSGVTIGPDDNDYDQTQNQGDTIRVRAYWNLDELVFHPSTFQASREYRDLTKSRLTLSEYLFKIYEERRKLQTQYYLGQNKKTSKMRLLYQKMNALTEKLDLFTNGVFYDQWWREGD